MTPIIGQCAACCECPDAVFDGLAYGGTESKQGYLEYDTGGTYPAIPAVYRQRTISGTLTYLAPSPDETNSYAQVYAIDGYGTETTSGTITATDGSVCPVATTLGWDVLSTEPAPGFRLVSTVGFCGDTSQDFAMGTTYTNTSTVITYTGGGGGSGTSGTVTETLSDTYTTAQLVAFAISEAAYIGHATSASLSVSADELLATVTWADYWIRFQSPSVGSGTCYRVEWVERFVPASGVAIDSFELLTRGVYRPQVTWTGGGGTGLVMMALMDAFGGVSGIRVLNQGSGFTSSPTITIEAAINGGTTATGWTANLTEGRVSSVSGGTAGDYLPTGAFAGGGSGAAITFSLDETGGISGHTLGSGGSGYTYIATLVITRKVASAIAATFFIHFGTEIDFDWQWDGSLPVDYDPDDYETWPKTGTYGITVSWAEGEGVKSPANARAYCRGCA